MSDRTGWITLADVSRICQLRGGTRDEDRWGLVSAPYATFLVRLRYNVKNGTQEALNSSDSVS